MAQPSWIRRLFTRRHSSPSADPQAERIMLLEHQLQSTQSFIKENILPWYGPMSGFSGSSDLYGTGYGQALNDDGLPLVPWATGTPSDRAWGKLAPLFWTEPQLAQFRSAARWVADTNPFAVGFMDLLVGMHIQKGCTWTVRLKGSSPGKPAIDLDGDGTPDVDPLVAKAQDILDSWRQVNRWALRSQEGFRRWRRDGDVFLRFIPAGKLPVVRFVEPEQIATPDGDSSSRYSFGIETKETDRETPLRYFVRWVNDKAFVWETVEAAQMVHLKANVDASIKRGLPDFVPVGADLDRVRGLLTNMGETARSQAAIAWWEKVATATQTQVSTMIEQGRDYSAAKLVPGGFTTQDANKLQPGTVVTTEQGRDVAPGPSSTPAGFIEVEQALLRGLGIRWNFPEYFSGDASNQNLASIRESGSPFVRVAEMRQLAWCEGMEKPTATRILKAAEETGLLPPGACDQLDVDIEAPSVALSDKAADESIRAAQNAAGVLSRTTWQAKAGYDPAIEAANIRKEKAEEQAQQPQQQPAGEEPDPAAGLMESVVRILREIGPPPFPGAVFNRSTHRWEKPKKSQGKVDKTKGKKSTSTRTPQVGGEKEKMAAQAKAIVKKIKPTKERAYTGTATGTKIDSRMAGAIGEEILIQHLKSLGYADADQTSAFLKDDHNNLPMDLIHDHQLIEAKTGQSFQGDKGVWALKYDGRYTNEQEEMFKKMSPEKAAEAKKKINAAKVKGIHDRKKKFIERMNKELGFKIKAGMMTVIINPDTKTADIYKFDGIHDRIPFKSEMAQKGYVGSVKYG